MKLPFLPNVKNNSSSSNNNNNNIVQQQQQQQPQPKWKWLPSCHHQPRTHSFRAYDDDDDDNNNSNTLLKAISSAYLLESITEADETPESGVDDNNDLPLESVDVRALRSDRLFFEPGETSSIMEEATKRNDNDVDDDDEEEEEEEEEEDELPFKESVVLSMETRDPYFDFKESMEEMVEAQGLKDWEGLEQLLSWYLRANGKCNHGYIIGAFVDLLVGRIPVVSNSKSDAKCSPSSPLSFYTSSSSSSSLLSSSEDCSSTMIRPLEAEKEIDEDDGNSHCLLGIKGNEDDASSSSLALLDVFDSSY